MPSQCRNIIRAVIYDVDGTMYHLWPMRLGMACQLAGSLVVRPGKTRRAMKVLRAYRGSQEALRGQASGQGGEKGGDPQLLAAAATLGMTPEAIGPVIEEWIVRRPLAVLKRCRRSAVLDAIRILHELRTPQAVYSDYPPQHKLAALGVADCIDAAVWSAQPEVHHYKPSPRGFLRAAELLGVEPAACAYVGDRPEVDGAGARAAGMRYIDASEIPTARTLVRRVAP